MYFGRGKNKVQNPYTLKDTYLFYQEEIGSNSIYDIEKPILNLSSKVFQILRKNRSKRYFLEKKPVF